jgi:hypothetical protein
MSDDDGHVDPKAMAESNHFDEAFVMMWWKSLG